MSTERVVVLVGAGHAHLHVVAHARGLRRAGARVVLVDPGVFWYSGLATGVLGGMYEPALDWIDPRPLVERHGGRFVRDRVVAVDAAAAVVHLASGGRLGYDALSLNVGSEVDLGVLAAHADTWPVKPIGNLWRLRRHLERAFGQATPRVVVVGAGPTGCEVAANVDALARRHGAAVDVTIVGRGRRLLADAPAGAARTLAVLYRRRGIRTALGRVVAGLEAGAVVTVDGERLPCDLAVVATGLRAPAWLTDLGLAADPRDGLRVRATLQARDDERIFAAGDCASFEGGPLPKLGVFGVREGPVLLHNLASVLAGRPLRHYRPQRRYLSILNLGCGDALALWGRWYWRGRSALWLKDRLDRRFLARHRVA